MLMATSTLMSVPGSSNLVMPIRLSSVFTPRKPWKGTSFGAPLENVLAEMIDAVPSIEMVRFVNSGTEACMAVCADAPSPDATKSSSLKAATTVMPICSWLRQALVLPLGLPDSPGVFYHHQYPNRAFNDLETVKTLFEENRDEIAGVILEPGRKCWLYCPDAGFLEGLRQLTQEHGALLVFDEVMTGSGLPTVALRKSLASPLT